MYELIVRRHFDASHIVEGHPGKCANLHGHRWVAEVAIRCRELNPIGIAIDFGDIRRLLDEVLPDHRHINDVIPPGYKPTAEGISAWLTTVLSQRVAALGGDLSRVTIWESPDAAATYDPDAATDYPGAARGPSARRRPGEGAVGRGER